MRTIVITLFIVGLLSLLSCSTHEQLTVVQDIDIGKYQGKWYEIAKFPTRFEKDLKCVSAQYQKLDNGTIQVFNKGYNYKKNEWEDITGTAKIQDKSEKARLKVQFFWPFSGDYQIMYVDSSYSYALVGSRSRKYLWILAREKTLDQKTMDSLLARAKNQGFDTDKITYTKQDCMNTES